MQIHEASSVAFLIKCRLDESLDEFYLFRGPNCIEQFLDKLVERSKFLFENHILKGKRVNMTDADREAFRTAPVCHICKRQFMDLSHLPNELIKGHEELKVIDHCHLTGQFRGAAHNKCNIKYFLPKTLPIFCHNFSNYDSHIIIEALSKIEPNEELSVIAGEINYFSLYYFFTLIYFYFYFF